MPPDSASTSSTPANSFVARVVQEELSQDLVSKGTLSDWFSRDEIVAPHKPLPKKPNSRNLANAEKAEELERELERYATTPTHRRRCITDCPHSLKQERAEWDELMQSTIPPTSPVESATEPAGQLSPLHPDLLDSPQRAILEQLHAPPTTGISTSPSELEQRLRTLSENLEFAVDRFVHGIHALSTTRETAERLADRTLADAAEVLEERDEARRVEGKGADAFSALRALGKVMNGSRR